MQINKNRIRKINNASFQQGNVLYWMSRDQRVNDNWSLLTAQKIAANHFVTVVFNLVPEFLEATLRQYDFMLKGLKAVEEKLSEYNIPFKVLLGNPTETIPDFISKSNFTSLIMDFDPLKIKQKWQRDLLNKIDIPVFEVDANNIVPVWKASDKQEYAAYTIRKKIHRNLPEFLTPYSSLTKQQSGDQYENDWKAIYDSLKINQQVKPVDWLTPGENGARNVLLQFLRERIHFYVNDRNDPNKEATSDLSPYLHFGQISAQRVALEVENCDAEQENKDAFLEELIVRNELADNYCYYCKDYDNPKGFSDWAKKTLQEHEFDPREYVYALNTFEDAETHDDLWNAAQNQMVKTGKMHGYMRMYWAKKILEWSPNPEDAMKIAIYLNDKYELDGRDPRGYTGIAWSIGGVHDRAWTEREVFGKIRYMNYNGCKRKFDVKRYIETWL
ncbi:MAG: deoxyribodipyrimidine photo-lyase [Fidelibacterota bacterium]